ncbi:MAG: carboxypeptidase-like regulatory domain-containing protein [Desulfobacteraceae bacterium]|nr:carboxypeptidase-like regulatory domain-containing protein [Desulfobacteraceae bacterium]
MPGNPFFKVKQGGKLLAAIIISFTFLLSAKAVLAGPPAKIEWDLKRLELEVPAGGTLEKQVFFVPDRDTDTLKIETSPSLSGYLKIEPGEIESTQAGKIVNITVTAALDVDQKGKKRAGTIHVREGEQTLADTLKVTIVKDENACGIRGTVHQKDEGVEGVIINLDGPESGTAETDDSGTFSFSGLTEGEYSVFPGKEGFSFEPENHTIQLNDCPENREIDFTAEEAVADITADPSTIKQGELSTLQWSCLNVEECIIEPDVGQVEMSGSIEVSPENSVTYSLTALGPGDSATDEVTVEVRQDELPEISIISPSAGEFLARKEVTVRGTIEGISETDVGVSVNSTALNEISFDSRIPANVYEEEFAANNVPLMPGDNTITVIVTSGDLEQISEESVEVYCDPADYTIKAESARQSAVAPLEATLEIDADFNITDSSVTCSGPAPAEITEQAPDEYEVRMTEQGLYFFTVEAADPENNILADEYVFMVMDEADLDEKLRSKWNGLKSALAEQDIQGALQYFTDDQKHLYSNIYSALEDELPETAAEMKEIEFLYAKDNLAKYKIYKDEHYGGEEITVAYYIYFVKTSEGLWKIHRY